MSLRHGHKPVRDPSDEAAIERIASVYQAYAASARRRKAWNPANPGNVLMRAELERALLESGALQRPESSRVLDLGCGHGYWLSRLLALGVAPERLTGVDVLPERIVAASRAAPSVALVEADAADLPFQANSFDLTILFTVLSSVADERRVNRVLAETRRVTAASGLILIYEPRLPNPLNRATRRIRRQQVKANLGQPAFRRTLTVFPPVARGLGRATTLLYPYLARVRPFRTHVLLAYRLPD